MSAASSFVADFCALAQTKGLDVEGLLARAGIAPAVILNPGGRVPNEYLAELAVSVWDELGDEGMGLTPRPIPRGAFHMMGCIAIGEATQRAALEQACRFYSMLVAYEARIIERGELAEIRFEIASHGQQLYHLLAEITVLAWHRLACWLVSENVVLTEACFHYPRPAHVAEYGYLFPTRHVFDADALSFSFPRQFLDRSVNQSRSVLDVFMRECPAELFSQPKVDFSIAGELARVLRRSLPDRFPSLE